MTYKIKLIIALLCASFLAVLGFFGFKLFQVQVVDRDKNTDADPNVYTYYTRVIAARGEIIDRNGNLLVSNRASYNLILTNYALFSSDDPNESLRQLVALGNELGLSFTDHLPVTKEKPYEYIKEDFGSTWLNHFRTFLDYCGWDADVSAPQLIKLMRQRFHIPNDWTDAEVRGVLGLRYELSLRDYTSLPTYTLMSDVTAEADLAALMELGTPGMSMVTGIVREYNTTYAAHVLGHIGPMNSQQYEYYKDFDYAMDALVGQDGLEKVFESELHGKDGLLRTDVDRDGNIVAQYYEEGDEPVAGNNVELTLDMNLQIAAEQALERIILELREKGITGEGDGKDAKGGAVVVLDVKTGEVLACASYPTYNLATYSKDFNELRDDPYSPLYNRALDATNPPGSTFKMVTTIAAIDSGTIGRFYPVQDRGVYTYYEGYQPACYYYTANHLTHGLIDVEQALAVSCNYYFYHVGRLTGWEEIDKVAKAMGLGEPTGVELPEHVGRRGNPETKMELYGGTDLQAWVGGDTISLAIGQSENRFTPMQLAVYTATLANRGVRYRATFLSRIISADYQKLLREIEPEVVSELEISDEAYLAYTNGMRLAVTLHGYDSSGQAFLTGTARKVFNDYKIGDQSIAVAAKTGTAQHGSEGSDHASFVCYAPFEDPQIAVAVYVENGAQGGNLGNVAKAIFDVYFATQNVNDSTAPENGVS